MDFRPIIILRNSTLLNLYNVVFFSCSRLTEGTLGSVSSRRRLSSSLHDELRFESHLGGIGSML